MVEIKHEEASIHNIVKLKLYLTQVNNVLHSMRTYIFSSTCKEGERQKTERHRQRDIKMS